MDAASLKICLSLPMSTSANAMYAHGGRGGVRISDDYRAWKKEAGQVILSQRPAMLIRALPLDRPYGIAVRIAETDPGDIDNRVKTLLDLLRQMRMTPDDKLLWTQSICRATAVQQGVMRVTVWTLDPAEQAARMDEARAIAEAPWCYSSEAVSAAMLWLLERAA